MSGSMYLMDGIAAGIWLVLNLVTLQILMRLYDRLFGDDDFVNRGLFIAGMFVAMLVLAGTICGALGLLTAFRQQLLCLILVRLLDWRTARFAGMTSVESVSQGTKSATELAPWWNVLRWAPICLLVSHSVLNGVLTFPTDFDSLWYHLPLIDFWLQSGSLYVPDCARWYFPANSELIGVWATAGCSGDFFVPLNNVPVVVLWGFATRSIFASLGHRGMPAVIGTGAVLAVYTTIHETIDASNDLLVVASFSSAIAWTLRLVKLHHQNDRTHRWNLRSVVVGLVGVSIGILAGTKHFAIGYALGAFLLFAISVSLQCQRRDAWRCLISCMALAIPFSGYWYLRNWWVTGLPLYPMGAGDAVGENTYPDLWSTSILGNGHPQMLSMVLDAIWNKCGPIHWAVVSLLPAVGLGWLCVFYHRRASRILRDENLNSLLIALAVLGCQLIWVVTPFCVEDEPGSLNHLQWAYTPVRYGLCFLSMSVIAGISVSITIIRPLLSGSDDSRRNVLIFGATMIAVQWGKLMINHRHQVQPEFLILLTVDALIIVWMISQTRMRRYFRSLQIGTLVAVMLCGAWASAYWHTGLTGHFQRYTGISSVDRVVDRNAPSTVLVFDQRCYPWFGSARQNRIVQPSEFQSLDETNRLIQQRCPQFVVTRQRPEYSVFVYAQAWNEVPELSEFVMLDRTNDLRVYRLKNLEH